MKLEDKSTKELLELHNSIADVPAGPKTFSTKVKLLARIRSLAEVKGIDLSQHSADNQSSKDAASEPSSYARSVTRHEADPGTTSTEEAASPKKRGMGIGELARKLLMDPVGYPHSLIAAMVNAQIPGATATDKSVRWYAAKMRKQGVQVPLRKKAFPAEMDETQSKKWLSTISVVTEAMK
jgi:hypothetical protein